MDAPERIWVWPFNAGWGGGYWRSKTQAPETEAGGFWAVPEDVVEARIAEAVKAEREACAAVAEGDPDAGLSIKGVCLGLAAAIRARGNK